MSAGGSANPVVLVMFLAISACVSAPESGWAQEERMSAVHAEVFVYGNEQALVDAMMKRSDRRADQEYRNELDHVFSALLTRAYPKPETDPLSIAKTPSGNLTERNGRSPWLMLA